MLKRSAWNSIESWNKKPHKKALLIKGARQIGKTTLVREFARQHYDHFAEINFLENKEAALIFEGALNANTIVENLTAFLQQPLVPGETLILLDEIQECPAARTAIKFLVEDGRFDYIETGSLLGVKTRQVESYPVGFEEHLQMFPLTFKEFCIANGVQQQTLDYLEECFKNRQPVAQAVHQTMLNLFNTYLVVGGMPEVVQEYITNHDISNVIALQNDLLNLYRLDIAKYADAKDETKVRAIFDAIPSQLDDKNRRFVLADLAKSARSNRYQSSFLWLADAGVALPCYNVSAPTTPLEANSKHSLMKLFMGDTGLLSAASFGNVQFDLLQGRLEVNMGAILENAIAQELRANGFDLYYFNSKRIGEVDFVVQNGKNALPMEVKSGNDWARHKALNNMLAVDEWSIPEALVLCKGNVQANSNVTYLPLYMTMFLKPTALPEHLKHEVDLSALSQIPV